MNDFVEVGVFAPGKDDPLYLAVDRYSAQGFAGSGAALRRVFRFFM